MIPLPIDPHLEMIRAELESHPVVILQADPGSGKTTRVPPAILDLSFCHGQQVLVLEPRRLAAKYSAERVASERGEKAGQTVGYRFRFERCESAQTRLFYLTEGTFLRQLQNDPTLRKVGAVVLDEFHERSLLTDVAYAYLQRLQQTTRRDLRLIFMSATLNLEKLTEAMPHAKIIAVKAPRYDVAVHYAAAPPANLETGVRSVLRSALESHAGGALVFLPGMAEIRRVAQKIEDFAKRFDADVLALHGELDRDIQARAIGPSAKRKIVLSTNVAETSLTLDGIGIVIDSGLQRQASFSPWNGIGLLSTKITSQASAIQRAGRAGRTGPGVCYRLYTRGDFETRPVQELPEIQRTDLSQTMLELAALGIDLSDLPWLDRPPEAAVENARRLLTVLGAIKSTAEIRATDVGKQMARLPCAPRLAKLMLRGAELGVARTATRLATLLMDGRNLSLDILSEVERGSISERTFRQLWNSLSTVTATDRPAPVDPSGALAQAALAAFPDRVAKIKGSGSKRDLVLASGGASVVEDAAIFHTSDFFIVLDIEERRDPTRQGTTLRARSVIACAEESLLDLNLEEQDRFEWNPSRGYVEQIRTLKLGQLVLEETRTRAQDSDAAFAVATRANLGIDIEVFRAASLTDLPQKMAKMLSPDQTESILARLCSAMDRETARTLVIEQALQHLRNFGFGKIDSENGASILLGEHYSKVERSAPTSLMLANDRRAKIHYALDREPWAESRLQDFFGLKQIPSVGPSKTPLTLHLLAPNGRAVQVTKDLASFWKNTYPEVRKELMRRYPRHSWPEDPAQAKPPEPRRPRR